MMKPLLNKENWDIMKADLRERGVSQEKLDKFNGREVILRLRDRNKLAAIKSVKSQTSLGLKDCKDFIDNLVLKTEED